jgi:hypothetical protein
VATHPWLNPYDERCETLAERRARLHALMTNLLHEKQIDKQIDRYGLFAMTTEGRRFPDGSESASGFVVASSGDVFSVWLDWSEREHRPWFSRWTPVTLKPDWADDDEYTAALAAAGVPHPRRRSAIVPSAPSALRFGAVGRAGVG